ncbi:MAG: acyl-CoA dehydrogenase family protein [Candidatus Aminicenantia bacterium]
MKKTSITKSLFEGQIEKDLIFPYPEQKEDEKEIIKELISSWRRFSKERIDPAKMDSEGRISENVIKEMANLGILGISIPEEYGGAGLSQWANSQVMEALAVTDASLATFLGAHLSLCSKGVLYHGTDEQKKKFLPLLARGEKIGAYALTEPSAGSDPSSLRTTARPTPDGKFYILNGTKLFITNGGYKGIFLIFAKTEDDKITGFIVDGDSDGLSVTKEEKKMGIKASSTSEIVLDNVKVPVENMLGEKGHGLRIALEILDLGRLGLAAGCAGGAKALTKLSSDYASQRVQFGSPISNFELIKKKIAQMAFLSYAMDSMVYLTSYLSEMPDVDFSLESSICKTFCSEGLWEIADDALQIAGGYGYIEEYPYEKYLRDSRINIIFEGTNEIQRMFISLYGIKEIGDYFKKIGKALQSPFSSIGVLKEFAIREVSKRLRKEKLYGISDVLKRERKMLEDYVHELGLRTEGIIKKYGKKIIEREYVQERLSDIAIYLYAMLSTLSRTDSLIKNKGEESCSHEINLCKAFFFHARKNIRHRLSYLERNIDRTWDAISEWVVKNKEPF